jgi:hypothetical protein
MLEKWIKIPIRNRPELKSDQCGIKGYNKEDIESLLPRHAQFSQQILRGVHRTPEAVLQNIGSPFARKVDKMIKELFREVERCKQFTRTKLNKKGILYAEIAVNHRIEDFVLKYFHERFPNFIICLFNIKKKETISINELGLMHRYNTPLSRTVNKISANRTVQPYFDDIMIDNEKLFEQFYASQFINSRENRRYFKQMIPDKCMDLPGMKGGIEKQFRNNKLDKFL